MKINNLGRFILFTVFFVSCTEQPNKETGSNMINQEETIVNAVNGFYNAIIESDEARLWEITADELVYAHSGGKVQSRDEFITEIMDTEFLDYLTVDLSEQTVMITGQTAIVRHIFSTNTLSKGEQGNIRIGIMLVWQNRDGSWKLLARQAYKLPQ